MIKALLSFLYPPNCLACGGACRIPEHRLCESCVSLLELVNPLERCRRCFSPIDSLKCRFCAKVAHPFSGVASAFEFKGPPSMLVNHLKNQRQHYLAKSLAAFLIMQFLRLDWPLPDAVISVPIPFVHRLFHGAGPGALIGREVAHFLRRPFIDGIKCVVDRHSSFRFSLKPSLEIQDKTLLLIDDVIKPGEAIFSCGEKLLEGFPKCLYGLAAMLDPSFYSEEQKHRAADGKHK